MSINDLIDTVVKCIPDFRYHTWSMIGLAVVALRLTKTIRFCFGLTRSILEFNCPFIFS